jgi:hypothetical protein
MAYVRYSWGLIAVMAAFTVASFIITGLRVDPFGYPYLPVPFCLLGVVWWIYRRVRPDTRVEALVVGLMQILLILLLGSLLSYAAIALCFPLQDAALLSIDKAMGIDRHYYIEFFAQRRYLHNAVVLAYFSLMPQLVLVPMALFMANQIHRLQQFTVAVGFALFATVLISVFVPALSTTYLDLGLSVGAKLPPHMGVHIPIVEKLRSGMPFLIDLDEVEGLVTFPSFHTVGALLFIWATWHVLVVRWLSLALNAALIAATPIVGTHYFIDIVAGAAIALAAVIISRQLQQPAEPKITEGQEVARIVPVGTADSVELRGTR